MGFALTSTTLFAGGAIGPSFSLPQLITVILVGNLILGAYCAALGYIAAQSGLSTVLMARFSFWAMWALAGLILFWDLPK